MKRLLEIALSIGIIILFFTCVIDAMSQRRERKGMETKKKKKMQEWMRLNSIEEVNQENRVNNELWRKIQVKNNVIPYTK